MSQNMESFLLITSKVLQKLQIIPSSEFFKISFQELEEALTIIQFDAEKGKAAVDDELLLMLTKLDDVLWDIDAYLKRVEDNFKKKVCSVLLSAIPLGFLNQNLKIPRMHLEIKDIKKRLNEISGILKAKSNLNTKRETISFEPKLDITGHSRYDTTKLIYDQLPPQLKQCVLYCSFFPKYHEFCGSELVQFWMANGLLPSLNVVEEPEVIGMQYLQTMLRSKLIFTLSVEESFDAKFKMQESWYDFALSVASTEYFGLAKHSDGSYVLLHFRNRHLFFSGPQINLFDYSNSSMDYPNHVQTLMLSEMAEVPLTMVESVISRCQYLQTLIIKNSSLEELPKGIDNLKNLKYLDLSGNEEIRKIPNSICKLRTLQTLMLQNCAEIGELPRDIRHMVGLRTLKITTRQSLLPENGIGCLISLRYLAIIGCRNLQYLPQGIHFLTGLGTLMIRDCDKLIKLPRSMKYLVALKTLVIENCKMLRLNTKAESEGNEDDHQDHLIGSGLSLHQLCIANAPKLVAMPQWLIKRSANSLLRLHIKDCPKLKILPMWLQNLTSLESLEILRCPEFSTLPEQVPNLTSVKEVRFQDCPHLELHPEFVPMLFTSLCR